ncbi:tail fiber assembly protein [Morganella morganii]|uniref:tail fiber assembly protein n=1 Tax=Morganella morganii TaxID=582 RepID=UPI003EBEAAB3
MSETTVINQKFFKDADNNIFCIDIMPMNRDSWESEIKDGWTEISKNDAMSIVNPLPIHEQLVADAEIQKQNLMAEARERLSVLQDAVDLGMAVLEEEVSLKEWKKYRVLLDRISTASAPDIDWPVKP